MAPSPRIFPLADFLFLRVEPVVPDERNNSSPPLPPLSFRCPETRLFPAAFFGSPLFRFRRIPDRDSDPDRESDTELAVNSSVTDPDLCVPVPVVGVVAVVGVVTVAVVPAVPVVPVVPVVPAVPAVPYPPLLFFLNPSPPPLPSSSSSSSSSSYHWSSYDESDCEPPDPDCEPDHELERTLLPPPLPLLPPPLPSLPPLLPLLLLVRGGDEDEAEEDEAEREEEEEEADCEEETDPVLAMARVSSSQDVERRILRLEVFRFFFLFSPPAMGWSTKVWLWRRLATRDRVEPTDDAVVAGEKTPLDCAMGMASREEDEEEAEEVDETYPTDAWETCEQEDRAEAPDISPSDSRPGGSSLLAILS